MSFFKKEPIPSSPVLHPHFGALGEGDLALAGNLRANTPPCLPCNALQGTFPEPAQAGEGRLFLLENALHRLTNHFIC